MSIQFNDTTTYRGLVQIYEKEAGYNRGDVSGNPDLLKEFTADVNLAMDDFFTIGFKASGTWQLDDTNFTDYPILTAPIVSGQRDYSFLADGAGNLILDIFKVLIRPSTSGAYVQIFPKDVQSEQDTSVFTDGRNTAGIPTSYDKTGNAFFLDFVPNYNSPDGIKIYVNREGSYFTYTDTTKKPGVPGNLHRYFAIKPALDYARRKTLKNYSLLADEVMKYEGDEERGIVGKIERVFGRKERDTSRGIRVIQEDTH